MKIGIASDHRGYKLKQEIIKNLKNYDFVDYGTTSEESVESIINRRSKNNKNR